MTKHLRTIPALLILLILSLAAAACSAGSEVAGQGAIPAAGEAQGPEGLQFPSAQLDSLPAQEPINREVSGPGISFLFSSLTPISNSPNAGPVPQGMQITASGGNFAYLLYRVSLAGSRPVELTNAVDATGSNCWFGMANYESKKFEFTRFEDLETGPISLADEKWQSPNGNVYFAYVAFDGAQLTAGDYKLTLQDGEPVVHEVLQTNGFEALSIITLDGRPGIFHYQGADDSLCFAHATNSQPASSSDWVVSVVDAESFPGLFQSAMVYQGKPLVAYSANGAGELRLAWSDSDSPQTAADWQNTMVDDGEMTARHVSLDVVDGQPAIAYYRLDGSDVNSDNIFGYVYYACHLGTDLASGWQSYKLAAGGQISTEPSLEVIAGRPAVAFANSQNDKLTYMSADRAFPLSPAHWQSFPTGRDALAGRLRLKNAGGYPVLLYPRSAGGYIGYLWGLKSVPEADTDWQERVDAATRLGLGTNFDLLVDHGRVDLLGQYRVDFQGQDGPSHNQFMFIERLFGHSYEDGEDPSLYFEYQSSKTVGPGYCGTLVNGQPGAAYMDSDGSRLMYGRIVY